VQARCAKRLRAPASEISGAQGRALGAFACSRSRGVHGQHSARNHHTLHAASASEAGPQTPRSLPVMKQRWSRTFPSQTASRIFLRFLLPSNGVEMQHEARASAAQSAPAQPYLAVLSRDPDTQVVQSGVMPTHMTSSVCPCSVCSSSSGVPHTLQGSTQQAHSHMGGHTNALQASYHAAMGSGPQSCQQQARTKSLQAVSSEWRLMLVQLRQKRHAWGVGTRQGARAQSTLPCTSSTRAVHMHMHTRIVLGPCEPKEG